MNNLNTNINIHLPVLRKLSKSPIGFTVPVGILNAHHILSKPKSVILDLRVFKIKNCLWPIASKKNPNIEPEMKNYAYEKD